MSVNQQITLYNSKASSAGQRVTIALEEAKVPYTTYPIEIFAPKPVWYLEKINPPGLTQRFSSNHASFILEFIADLHPHSNLLPPPHDPVARAKVRLFIDAVNTHVHKQYTAFMGRAGGPHTVLLDGLRRVQALLPELRASADADADGGKWAVEMHFTIADAAFAPIIARVELACRYGIGRYGEGENRRLMEALEALEFARMKRYREDLYARESLRATWDEEYMVVEFKKYFA
ncbi:hypothetical protein CONPUDRAFT_72139 [Coniophora puteana RWD-64-598 SS2]|uniref:GST N-terminal domain-containing protein n=1 Tax=Coniophora puteana (strain RWD-64-598) TaxID=741705 RepID=A0A5M3MSM1_CONPW|nr:uncharacterized protein CONPUDRAFT_72139 [Coniophora puteana RWD-64-598 SS2]EIW81734.1 hypothetical protein CONPUDRAFT_72139 [Coniophora puteana RWD-64-598 SS2]